MQSLTCLVLCCRWVLGKEKAHTLPLVISHSEINVANALLKRNEINKGSFELRDSIAVSRSSGSSPIKEGADKKPLNYNHYQTPVLNQNKKPTNSHVSKAPNALRMGDSGICSFASAKVCMQETALKLDWSNKDTNRNEEPAKELNGPWVDNNNLEMNCKRIDSTPSRETAGISPAPFCW